MTFVPPEPPDTNNVEVAKQAIAATTEIERMRLDHRMEIHRRWNKTIQSVVGTLALAAIIWAVCG